MKANLSSDAVLSRQWVVDKNNPLKVGSVSLGSGKKVWWKCDENHEWEAVIKDRVAGKGCPYCKGKLVWPGFNDLKTISPRLAGQWHPTRNNFQPDTVRPYSNKKAWWLGECGHEWEAQINSRFSNNRGCPICAGRVATFGFNDLSTTHPHLAAQWHPTKNGILTPKDVTSGNSLKAWWICNEKHEWKTYVYSRTAGYLCPTCSSHKRISSGEEEIETWLSEQTLTIKNDRSVLNGKELDIYLPEERTAIEFNGVYWHDENHKSRTYHYDKWLACKEAGVQLIQIWEDDWNRNPELIKKMLAHKLKLNIRAKFGARATQVCSLNQNEVSDFMKKNHIQGFSTGSFYLGLRNRNNKIVAAIILKKEYNQILTIVRYASSVSVPGGFTKLLKYAGRTYNPTKFVTFSDNTVSDGGLYETNGFTATKQLPPDYMYVVKGERKHKFGYRLKKFKNDPNLLWEKGLSERELALLNKIPRIWDAGKTKWEKDFMPIA